MKLTIHTADTAPPASRPVLQGVADDLGLVPNLAGAIAESPTLLAVFDAMRGGRPPADPAAAAVYALARDVVLTRGKVDDEVVDRALTAGLSPAAVLEVVAECAFAGLVGTVDNLADRVPLDEFLAPRA